MPKPVYRIATDRTSIRRLAHRIAGLWIENNLQAGAEIERHLGDDIEPDDPVALRLGRELQSIADKLLFIGQRDMDTNGDDD